jgi:hypothetical protein
MNDVSNPEFIWQVESLRFTLFCSSNDKQTDSSLWEKITGLPPESRTNRPQERLSVEEGLWDNNQLSVVVRPDRIDVIIASSPIIIPELPNIGQLEVIISKIPNLLDKLLFNEVTRIAFGLVLLHTEQDHSSAYKTLAKLLPNVRIQPDAREFIYQINLPTTSKNELSIEINRLQHWSAVFVEFMNVADLNRVKLFATRVELDISTDKDGLLPASSNIRNLMDELIEEAIAIVKGKNHV